MKKANENDKTRAVVNIVQITVNNAKTRNLEKKIHFSVAQHLSQNKRKSIPHLINEQMIICLFVVRVSSARQLTRNHSLRGQYNVDSRN